MRLRQYLGTQYMEPGNMVGEPPANCDGEEVTKGIPDPFVESV